MKTVLFVTGNKRKLHDASSALKEFGIKVDQLVLDVDEIQSHNPEDIAAHKARQAFVISKSALVVNDAFWSMPGLNGFPGGYLKDIVSWFDEEDFISLLKNKTDRRVCITETITFVDGEQTKVFRTETWGEIVLEPRGIGNPIERIAEFNGHTLAEMHENDIPFGEKNENVWRKFGKWYEDR